MRALWIGALILLRPVTGRLLWPQHQVLLWYAGWLLGVLSVTYSDLGQFQLLPVTFRSLVVPRVEQRGGASAYPAFFWSEAGAEAQLVLPGGTEVAVPHYGALLTAPALVWLGAAVPPDRRELPSAPACPENGFGIPPECPRPGRPAWPPAE